MKRGLCFAIIALLQFSCRQAPDTFVSNESVEFRERYSLQISAHRGNSGTAPENTLASFEEVLQLGVEYIEIDVRTTRDGKIVVIHDGTVDRTCNGSGAVDEFSLAELKALKANKGYESTYPEEQIPTLEEAAKLVFEWNREHQTNTQFYVDCKKVNPNALVAELKKYNMASDAVFFDDDEFLQQLKNDFPEAKLMPALQSKLDLDEKITRFDPYAFDVSYSALEAELIEEIHLRNIKVFTDLLDDWDQEVYYQKAFELKVDLIQTDKVKEVYEFFNSK